MNDREPESKRKGLKTASAGWICFSIGTLLMFTSLATFFIFGPLFLAAFILSIISMAQGRVAAGIVLLLVVLIVPTILGIGIFASNFNEVSQQKESEESIAARYLQIEEVRSRKSGNYMYLEGKIRNNGTTEAKYIKVEVEWQDLDGKVLDTDYTYAIGGEGLRPDGAKSFEIMTKLDRRMKKYRYRVID